MSPFIVQKETKYAEIQTVIGTGVAKMLLFHTFSSTQQRPISVAQLRALQGTT